MLSRVRAATEAVAALPPAKRWLCCPTPGRSLQTLATSLSRGDPPPPAAAAASSRSFFPKSRSTPSPRPFSSADLGRRSERDETEETEGEDEADEWEEKEEEIEPKIGDGGDGGGIVLGDVGWGERVLSIAREVLLGFGEDVELHAFRVLPKGYIYVRLDKLTNKFGCPTMEEIENFSNTYKKRLDEIGESGEISDDLALQVSSPGAERLLRIPDDLDRFKEMPMWVSFSEDDPVSGHPQGSEKALMLDSVDIESEQCVWKLANVRENRDVQSKGRPLSRKQRDLRISLHFNSIKRVTLYLDSKTK